MLGDTFLYLRQASVGLPPSKVFECSSFEIPAIMTNAYSSFSQSCYLTASSLSKVSCFFFSSQFNHISTSNFERKTNNKPNAVDLKRSVQDHISNVSSGFCWKSNHSGFIWSVINRRTKLLDSHSCSPESSDTMAPPN